MKLTTLLATAAAGAMAIAASAQARDLQAMADEINANLEAAGANYRLDYMEYITIDSADEAGRTVYFSNVGNKRLASHFVPGDTRRAWSGDDPNTIDWTYDTVDITADVSPADQKAAIYAAMATWDEQKCSDLGLNGRDVGDTGYTQGVLGLGPVDISGDVMQAGFFPALFFDLVAPNGSANILGVTFTWTFTGGDTNNDGYSDTAFRDIYYNDAFTWQASGGSYDIQTVAFHEAGHGLSQAHFGQAFRNSGNTKLHFAPLAAMNAAYSGVQHDPKGTDKGGHCSNWASWPN